jgi:hypothetical protein
MLNACTGATPFLMANRISYIAKGLSKFLHQTPRYDLVLVYTMA